MFLSFIMRIFVSAFCDIAELMQTLATNYQYWKEKELERLAELEAASTAAINAEETADNGC